MARHRNIRLIVSAIAFLTAFSHVAAAQKASRAVEAVVGYLKSHPAKHKLQDPASELALELERPDGPTTHIRLYQVRDGIRIRGTLIAAWVSPDGTVDMPTLETRQVSVKTTPAISRDRAYNIAVNDLKSPAGASLDTVSTGLEIVPKGVDGITADTLAWDIYVSIESEADSAVWWYVINAASGAIIDHRKVMPVSLAAPQQLAAQTTYTIMPSILRSAFWGDFYIYTLKAGSRQLPYTLQDPCYGVGEQVPTTCRTATQGSIGNTARNALNAHNNITRSPVFATATLVPDTIAFHALVPQFGNGKLDNSDPATAGTDVFITVQKVAELLNRLFNYPGGVTGRDVLINFYIHRVDGTAGEAFWTQTPPASPTSYSISAANLGTDARGFARTNATAPDVIAHECGHGLNSATYLGNQGPTNGEALAIEEANADIFAAVFEADMTAQGYRNMVPHWIGEQSYVSNWNGTTFTPQVALRYMDNPPRDSHPDPAAPARMIFSPACYSPNIGAMDQHYANGPYNHMFYLLANGGTSQCDHSLSVSGIGYTAARTIWFKTMKAEPPGDGYQQMKVRWLGTAAALYGATSAEVAAVQAAFDAIHVP